MQRVDQCRDQVVALNLAELVNVTVNEMRYVLCEYICVVICLFVIVI